MNNKITPELIKKLTGAASILVCAHVSPDGDTIGSSLAVCQALRALGKRVTLMCENPVPGSLAFLPGANAFVTPDSVTDDYDLSFAIDVSDAGRLGACADVFFRSPAVCVLDHHGTNPGFGQVNVVDPTASATGLLAYELITLLGVAVTADMGECLYAAISSDTGNFSFDCTDARTFATMSRIMESGFSLSDVNRRIFRQRSLAQTRLLGAAIASLTLYDDGRVAGTHLTRADFTDCGALQEHADTVVNYGLDVIGVRMAYLCYEAPDGCIRVSLRAQPGYNVSAIAKSHGGGGHPLAAGCTLHTTLTQAVALISGELVQAVERAG